LSAADLERLRARLAQGGMELQSARLAERLDELRRLYEPYATVLATHLELPLSPWVRTVDHADNWQTSAWKLSPPPALDPTARPASDETHF
jgi:hypothetical protein